MDATPREDELWKGLGGHFDSFTQVISEFVDNSVANFLGQNTDRRNIHVSAIEIDEETVRIKIEDTGTGIEDFEPVLRIGDKSVRDAPLNEHGFGLKHALASGNPGNDNWSIHTRTESDGGDNQYRTVTAPYRFDIEREIVKVSDKPWPGQFAAPGTLVQFECSMSFFRTIQEGIPGSAGFQRCLDYLREELGYKYAGVINDSGLHIKVSDGAGYSKTVSAVTPDWVDYFDPGSGDRKIDLGEGEITIEYAFGEVNESEDYVMYYQRNMDTSGVEIRHNGRVIADNLFSEVWNLERHPQYNHFLVKINLVSSDLNRLPKTKTAKNGIRSGDEKLGILFDWIRNTRPDPPQKLTSAVREIDLVQRLKENKETHFRSPDKQITTEQSVFDSLNSPVDVDLYVYDGSEVVLYEAKKGTADLQALYQLLMYWDGAVRDGITPDEGIILASDISDGVETVMEEMNELTDSEGNEYNFSFHTWGDEGIDFPE